jgi:surface polysaccharide O-acyltransferase-like enzyme
MVVSERLMPANRNDALDAFRLIAALFVIALHIELNPDLPNWAAVLIRLCGRWPRPFFFLATGYYLGLQGQSILIKAPAQSARILWIFCLASLLYIPEIIYESGLHAGIRQILSPTTFVVGTQFHLWFLSSMCLGLQVIYAAYRFRLERYLPVVAVLILLCVLAAGAYSSVYGGDGMNSPQYVFLRHLISVAFIYFGLVVGRHGRFLSLRNSALLALGGLLLECVEVRLLALGWGANPISPEILLGTIPLALGMLGVALAMNWSHLRWFSAWGRTYSLGIYVVHVWWLFVLDYSRPFLLRRNLYIPSPGYLALTFGLSLISLMILQRTSPFLKRLLDGRFESAPKGA